MFFYHFIFMNTEVHVNSNSSPVVKFLLIQLVSTLKSKNNINIIYIT